MGDFLPSFGGQRFSPTNISTHPDGGYGYGLSGLKTWFGDAVPTVSNTFKSLYGGFSHENLLPLAINKAMSDQYDFEK